MTTDIVSATERLRLLLTWLEGEVSGRQGVVDVCEEFLLRCGLAWGGPSGDTLGIGVEDWEDVTHAKLGALRGALHGLLERAVDPEAEPSGRGAAQLTWLGVDPESPVTAPPRDVAEPYAAFHPRRLPSLRFGAARVHPRPVKLTGKRAAERREITGSGHFRLTISGRLRDVMLYAIIRTLTEPGTFTLSRCPAPMRNDWSRTCGRFVISGGKRGRPSEYHSDACRQRAFRKKDAEKIKEGKR